MHSKEYSGSDWEASNRTKKDNGKTYKGKKRKCGACGHIDHMLSCNKCGGFTSTYVDRLGFKL